MGDIRRPEDIKRGRRHSHDLAPGLTQKRIAPKRIEDLLREIESLRIEVVKIKNALKDHGILVR